MCLAICHIEQELHFLRVLHNGGLPKEGEGSMSEQKARKPEPVNWNEAIEKTWQQLRSRYHPHPKIAELNRRLPLKGAQMQQEMLERIGRAAGVDTDHILK